LKKQTKENFERFLELMMKEQVKESIGILDKTSLGLIMVKVAYGAAKALESGEFITKFDRKLMESNIDE
jgi:hypothetical protein